MRDGLPGNERTDLLFGEFDYDDENVVISFPEEDDFDDEEDYEELDEDGVPIWYDPYEWDREIDEDRPY